jgi:hypothetical protein
MGVLDEAKNVIPLKFLRKIKNNFFFPLVNSIRGHTVYIKQSRVSCPIYNSRTAGQIFIPNMIVRFVSALNSRITIKT